MSVVTCVLSLRDDSLCKTKVKHDDCNQILSSPCLGRFSGMHWHKHSAYCGTIKSALACMQRLTFSDFSVVRISFPITDYPVLFIFVLSHPIAIIT